MYKGMWVREGTLDSYVASEQRGWKLLQLKDVIVLDIGAHIGWFTRMAIDSGAEHCASVEPYPDNCDMFELNFPEDEERVTLIEAAVVDSAYKLDVTSLYICGSNTSAHSITSFRGRKEIEVDVVSLEALLDEFHPLTVKLDAEGVEYMLMNDIMEMFPDYGVRSFAAELHLNQKPLWRDWGREFVSRLQEHYDVVVAPKITDTNWNTIGVWELRDGS